MDSLPNLIPPVLPPEATTFDCIDHGSYAARGFNPSGISGIIRGVPVEKITQDQWLSHKNTGRSGSTWIFRDDNGAELGRVHKPSETVAAGIPQPIQLVFRPTESTVPAKKK